MSDRLPFDPSKMAAKAGVPAPGKLPEGVLSVSGLAGLVDTALKQGVPTGVRVIGEVSGFSDRTHWYFTLKDDEAVVSAVMFASAAARCGFRPRGGERVIATGRVEFFAKQGRTQFYVTRMEPVGLGDLDQRLKALIEELRGLGWLDPERKRAVPRFPRKVAVVTSKTGAALQDVLDTLRRRCPAVEVLVADTRVQGPGSAEEVAAALGRVSANAGAWGVDAVILTRGGGSIEDLWAFNERVVAEAVLKCSVPVVAAIGHETDTTVAELVADERAATPTQAAMRCSPDRGALLEQLQQLRARAASLMKRLLRHEAQRLEAAVGRPVMSDPHATLGALAHRLELGVERLGGASRSALSVRRVRLERLATRLARHEPRGLYAARAARVASAGQRLERAVRSRLDARGLIEAGERLARAWGVARDQRAAALEALGRELVIVGPMSVLSRGYSITTLNDGRLVRSAGDAAPGAVIVTRVSDGAVRSVVEGEGGAEGLALGQRVDLGPRVTLPARRKSGKRRGGEDSSQMGLF